MAHTGQTYHVTLTFNLRGHGACCWRGSTASICMCCLKFLGLTIRKTSHILCECVYALVGLWPQPLTLKLVRNVSCSTCHKVPSSASCQFWRYNDYQYSFSIYGPLGQHGSDWSRDLVTLTTDLGGHGACGWCGSSYSIRIPSLKFVCLAIRKIWRTKCVTRWPWLLTFWPWVARI